MLHRNANLHHHWSWRLWQLIWQFILLRNWCMHTQHQDITPKIFFNSINWTSPEISWLNLLVVSKVKTVNSLSFKQFRTCNVEQFARPFFLFFPVKYFYSSPVHSSNNIFIHSNIYIFHSANYRKLYHLAVKFKYD